MAEFTPSSKGNACPVCSRTKDGDCRVMDDGLVLCHSFRGNALKNGDRPSTGGDDYRFIGDTEDGNWGRWKPAAQWSGSSKPTGPMPARLPKEWQAAAATTSTKSTSKRTAMAEVTLTAKLTRPADKSAFTYCQWDGTPVKATKNRTDHGDGRKRKIGWSPTLSGEGLDTADLAPYKWHEFLDHHQQHGGPVLISKGELKVDWARAIGLQAISIHGWNDRLAAELLKLGSDAVLVPDCDLADLQGWYAKACKALPQARHLLTPGANWAEPPEKGGVGLDDWLQTHLDSVTPNTASDLLAAITDQPWGGQDDERPRTSSELIEAVLTAQLHRDQDGYLSARAELIARFRVTDQMIQKASFQLMEKQAIGVGVKPTTNHVDMSQVEALRYRMDGHMLVGDIAMVGAAYGTGKTLLLAAKADAHVRGLGFLDREADDTTPGKVLFIATDSGTAPLLAAWYQLGIDHQNDTLYISGHPEQRVFVWGFEPGQGQEAWYCTPADILRLLEFIKEHGITYVVIDSVKSVCGDDIDYTSNQAVRALLRYLRNIVCKSTGVSIELINHDGSNPRSFAGAKSWTEEISMAALLTKVEDDNGNHVANQLEFTKDRVAPPGMAGRKVIYSLDRDGQLVLSQSQDKTGTCRDLLCDLLWQFHREGHQAVPVDQLAALAFHHEKSRKTVENTLSKIVGSGKGKDPSRVVRAGRGRYALTPAEQQRRQAAEQVGQVDQPSLPITPDQPAAGDASGSEQGGQQVVTPESSLNRALVDGKEEGKKLVIERDYRLPTPQNRVGSGKSEDLLNDLSPVTGSLFPLPTPKMGVGRTQTADHNSDSGVLPPAGQGSLVREATENTSTTPLAEDRQLPAPATFDPVIAAITDSDPDSWQPITFTSYRGDQIPAGLCTGSIVRSGPDGAIHQLAVCTMNNSWQNTAGQIIPIAAGWQVRRSQPATAPPAPASTAIPPVGTAIELAGPANTWKPGYTLESVGLSQVRLTPVGPEVGKNRISRALADLGNTWRAAA